MPRPFRKTGALRVQLVIDLCSTSAQGAVFTSIRPSTHEVVRVISVVREVIGVGVQIQSSGGTRTASKSHQKLRHDLYSLLHNPYEVQLRA